VAFGVVAVAVVVVGELVAESTGIPAALGHGDGITGCRVQQRHPRSSMQTSMGGATAADGHRLCGAAAKHDGAGAHRSAGRPAPCGRRW
jgi:hypothetical protein